MLTRIHRTAWLLTGLMIGQVLGAQPDAPRQPQVATEVRLLAVDANFLKEVGLDQNKIVHLLDDIEVNLILRAMQARPEAASLTAPRMTAPDGEVARTILEHGRGFAGEEGRPAARSIALAIRSKVAADRRAITLSAEVSCVDAQAGAAIEGPAMENLILPLREGDLWADQGIVRFGGTIDDRGTILVRLPAAWLDAVMAVKADDARDPLDVLLLMRSTIAMPGAGPE